MGERHRFGAINTMPKTPRNAACPCGSGQKFKKCCAAAPARQPAPEPLRAMSDEKWKEIAKLLHKHDVREQRRIAMQGLGTPIVSTEFQGHRLVAVGNRFMTGKWRTFGDFLQDYIKIIIGGDWGNAELRKPEGERHPLLRWYGKLCELQKDQIAGPPGTVYETKLDAPGRAYVMLAYDLYSCAHNAKVHEALLARIRNADLFEGAMYEAHVLAMCARAGFSIALEDEADNDVTHCEFVATHPESGRSYSVEAKAYTTRSAKALDISRPPSVVTNLKKALKKSAAHSRIVFIELARPENLTAEPPWLADLDKEIAEAEGTLTISGKPAPPAYLFVTNRPYLWAKEGQYSAEFMIGYGFKIADFMPRVPFTSILAAVQARRKHGDLDAIMRSFREFSRVPSTFDGDLPDDLFAPDPARLQLGSRYAIPNDEGARHGILVGATVLPGTKTIAALYRLDDGSVLKVEQQMSDREFDAYSISPSTYFGRVQREASGLKTPLDVFDFLHTTYSKTPTEKLLEFMKNWPEFESLSGKSQPELADHYCDRMGTTMWLRLSQKKTG